MLFFFCLNNVVNFESPLPIADENEDEEDVEGSDHQQSEPVASSRTRHDSPDKSPSKRGRHDSPDFSPPRQRKDEKGNENTTTKGPSKAGMQFVTIYL